MGSTPGAFRVGSDVLDKGVVDLIFQEAAVNDSSNGRSPEEMVRGTEGVLRQALHQNPATDFVLMHFADPGKMQEFSQGKIPVVIQQHELVAEHYGVPSLNLALEVTERIAAKQFTWGDDFKNLHPAPFGHRLYAASIRRLFADAWGAPLDPGAAISPRSIPEPIDSQSYGGGLILPLKSAQDLQGFALVPDCDPRAKGIGGGVRAGFVGVPMLVATESGSQLQLDFQGRAAGVWVAAGPDAGILEHRIDGGPWRSTDLYTRWSGGLHLPWVYLLATDLDGMDHSLTLRISKKANPKSKGHACRIVRFVVNR
jgi:hypothetical protein